jgi:hypothetical protein
MCWNTNRPIIGSIYSVSPKDIEPYSLRILLLARKGCTCFDDLKKMPSPDGNPDKDYYCSSFHAAAKELVLLIDEEEWHKCLDDANHSYMHGQMRFLFATILMNCEISDSQNLCDRHCKQLIRTQNRALPVGCLWKVERHNCHIPVLCPDSEKK